MFLFLGKITVTLSPSELINVLKEINTISKTEILEPESEECISRKNALALLNIDSSTLWNWEKTGYIKSQPFGGRKILFIWQKIEELMLTGYDDNIPFAAGA